MTDKLLTWFIAAWFVLVFAVNIAVVIGCFVLAPSFWAGVARWQHVYSPSTVSTYLTNLVLLSPAIGAMWWRSKLREPRCTNHYLCAQDSTRWDAAQSRTCNDRCPTCDAMVEPYATTRHADQSEVIHNREVYDRANVVGR